MKIKTILFSSAVLFAWSSITVQAADIIAEEPQVYDWTGFYLGANGGYGWGEKESVIVTTFLTGTGVVNVSEVGDLKPEGFFGGGQAGYNFQSGPVVFGIEGDIQLSDIDDDFSTTIRDNFYDGSEDIDWFGTVRGRLGWGMDRALLYVTGGIAFADVDLKVDFTDTLGRVSALRDSGTRTGYVLGAGGEWAFSDRWSAKLEYQFLDFGSESMDAQVHGPQLPVQPLIHSTNEIDTQIHTIRLGVNFQF